MQSWPQTECFNIKLKKPHVTCILPDSDTFLIHGIWPSQYSGYGPENCDSGWSLDLSKLKSIEGQLEKKWRSIQETRDDWFLPYQWKKHGTCATSIENLSTELKYFKTGLNWARQYDIQKILAKDGIRPGGSYYTERYASVIRNYLGVTPEIKCINNRVNFHIFTIECHCL